MAPDLFVLGNQKSGTTAVAALIAAASGRSVTLDLPRFWLTLFDILEDRSTLDAFLNANRRELRRDVVKEPSMTFVAKDLHRLYPETPILFVVRDPRDNVRSILDRLGLNGRDDQIDNEQWLHLPRVWKRYLSSNALVPTADNHIDRLAQQWQLAADAWDAVASSARMVRYETFVGDRQAVIEETVESLGWRVRTDVSSVVNKNYQPRGASRDVPWASFFSVKNLARIDRRTARGRRALGYLESSQL